MMIKICYSPNGHTMALLSGDRIRLKFIRKAESIDCGKVAGNRFTDLSFHPHGNCFITTTEGMILKWEISERQISKEKLVLEEKGYTAVCYVPSGKYIVTASLCGEINEYYGAMKSQFQKSGNHLSGTGNHQVIWENPKDCVNLQTDVR